MVRPCDTTGLFSRFSSLKDIFDLAGDLQHFFQDQNWKFCFIGGVATLYWGEPRVTRDVDVTLLTGFGDEERYVDALLTRYLPRRPDAREFSLKSRVLLLKSHEGFPADIALAALPYEEEAVRRSAFCDFGDGCNLKLCSCEDLIVMKAFASRERDWLDIDAITIRRKDSIDWAYVLRQIKPLSLLKEEPEILERLLRMRS